MVCRSIIAHISRYIVCMYSDRMCLVILPNSVSSYHPYLCTTAMYLLLHSHKHVISCCCPACYACFCYEWAHCFKVRSDRGRLEATHLGVAKKCYQKIKMLLLFLIITIYFVYFGVFSKLIIKTVSIVFWLKHYNIIIYIQLVFLFSNVFLKSLVVLMNFWLIPRTKLFR